MTENELKNIDLTHIKVGKNNPRKSFDEQSMVELTESIKAKGVLQPILVRPGKKTGTKAGDFDIVEKYELVCGERRLRAAKAAKLGTIPANIRELTDDEAFEMQITENLERKDVHPLEEAEAFKRMLDSGKYEIADIAAKFAKPETFIAQRLKFVDLIDEVKKDFYEGELGIGHAVEIARLDSESQKELFENSKEGWDPGYGTVKQLKNKIGQNLYELDDAAFDTESETLLPDAGPCSTCPKRSGANPVLFPDIEESDVCFDKTCYQAKQTKHIEAEVSDIINNGKDVVLLQNSYGEVNELILQIAKEFNVKIFKEYDDFQSYGSGKPAKGFFVNGRKAGKYYEIYLKNSASKSVATEKDSIEEQIEKIEGRAARALELDREKTTLAINEKILDGKHGIFNESPLQDFEKSMLITLMLFRTDWEGLFLGVKEYDYKLLETYERVQKYFSEEKFNEVLRRWIIQEIRTTSETDREIYGKAQMLYDLVKHYSSEKLLAIESEIQEKADKRITRTNERLEKLKSQISIPSPEPVSKKETDVPKIETKWKKVDKKYALNNSYFKNRLPEAPSNPFEIFEYFNQHNELPYDNGAFSDNWLYECFVEYQKRAGVQGSQFFTPPQTANRIAELADDFFDREEPYVLDACCGFGMLTKALHDTGFLVSGFDFDGDFKEMYEGFTENRDFIHIDFKEYTNTHKNIVSNPPYEVKELIEFLVRLEIWLEEDGKAILLLPMGFVDKERPNKLVEVLSKFNILHREDMTEDFARTKIKAEIVVIEKA